MAVPHLGSSYSRCLAVALKSQPFFAALGWRTPRASPAASGCAKASHISLTHSLLGNLPLCEWGGGPLLVKSFEKASTRLYLEEPGNGRERWSKKLLKTQKFLLTLRPITYIMLTIK